MTKLELSKREKAELEREKEKEVKKVLSQPLTIRGKLFGKGETISLKISDAKRLSGNGLFEDEPQIIGATKALKK